MINNDHDHNYCNDESERQRLLQSLPIVSLNENILPLPGGRRAHTLTDYSQPDDKKRQAMIDQMRKDYTDELKQMDTLDDPLEVCIRYLRWITDTFPTGDNEESKLYDVLRSTCLRFQEDTRYTSDPRYLKCWLDLAKHTDEPKDIYEFLMQKGIGQHLALFYEKYSMYYEEREK
jgi:checkpoint serine/threonine-protein kinase